jgi:hypothetical protein
LLAKAWNPNPILVTPKLPFLAKNINGLKGIFDLSLLDQLLTLEHF